MPRRREEEDHDLPQEESSVTQYDSPSDSTQGSEHSSQSGHTTHSTSLHSGRSRRLAAPVPVHAQGLYRADGMMYHALNGSRPPPGGPEGGAPLRRAPSMRSVRGMYDPEIHDAPPPPPLPRGKDAVSGDSLSYGSQPEYVHYVNPPPLSGMGPYSWADSTSGTSQELYFRGHRKYFRRSFCSVCLSVSIVTVIIAVIGIVAIAAYLGVMTTDDSEAMKYEMQYSGKFRVARGDFFHPSLADTNSIDFQDKAERYQTMIESLYGYSYLSDAFRRASVERFGNDSLTVFFKVHLDRRKIPTSVLNTEEAVRDVVTQEVMSLEPRAFRAISVDIDSIEMKREQNDGASNAPFISGGGSRRQETEPTRTRPAAASPAADEPGRDGAASSSPAPAPRQPDTAVIATSTERAASAPDSPVEPAKAEQTTETGAGAEPVTATERGAGEESEEPVPTAAEKEKGSPADHEEAYDSSDAGQETPPETDSSAGPREEPQSGPTTDRTEQSNVTEQDSDVTKPGSDATEPESRMDVKEAATEATATGNTPTETVSRPSSEIPEQPPADYAAANHPQADHALANHSPVDRTPVDPSPVDLSRVDPVLASPALTDPIREDADLPNGDDVTEEAIYDDTTESSFYEDFYDVTTEEAISYDPKDKPISYDVYGQPNSYDVSEPISDEVATELAPFMAASVPQAVDRIGYVDLSAPTNSQTPPRPADPPHYTDIQVGTAYFGGLAPAPVPTSAPAPAWAQLGFSGPASALAPAPAGQTDTWPQQQRPAPASQSRPETSLYDYNPWNPIIPAFAQSVSRPGSLFTDGGGVRRGGDYSPAVTVRPRPDLSQQGQGYAPSGVPAPEEGTPPPPEVTTTRRPYVQVAQQQSTSGEPTPIRPDDAFIPLPESVSIQQTLRILSNEDNDEAGSQKEFNPGTAFRRPSSPASSRLGVAHRPRPDSVLPNRPHPHPSARPSSRPTASSTEYHTEVSTSEVQEESQTSPDHADQSSPDHTDQTRPDPSQLLEPAGGVDRLGIAFVTRSPTRRPVPAPTAPATQRVVVVSAAPAGSDVRPAGGDVRPAGGDVRPTRPGLQPVTSYSGVYRPSRPRLPSEAGPDTPPPPPPTQQQQQQQQQPDRDDDQPGDDNGDADSAGSAVVSPQSAAGASPQPPRPLLSTGVSSMLAGALGGALTGAPDGPSVTGDVSSPSREQLLNLFRLIALRYPALVANMDQQQLQLLLNDEAARRKLLAPFLGHDKSRTPGEPQRTNTKLLELANISINGTRPDRRGNGRALRREVAGGLQNRPLPPPPRRPLVSHLSSSVLRALANFTRVKVAGGPPGSPQPRPVPTAAPGRPQTGPTGSLSDRLHMLVGFPTRAPPRGGNGTAAGSSRGKLSHKLMRFHGERTGPDGGEYDQAPAPLFAALRGTTVAPPLGTRRNLLRPTTRLPNSSPVHVIHYREGESVQDILDKIFARFQQRPGQNEVEAAAQKPWVGAGATLQPIFITGQNSLPTGRPTTSAADPSLSTTKVVVTTAAPSQPSLSSLPLPSNHSLWHEPAEGSSEPPEGSSEPAEVAEEADNEVGTAHLEGAATGSQPPVRPTLASLLRNRTTASCTDPTDFACRALGGCIPAASRCDRLLDCADGSDERDCTCADRLRAQSLHSKLCDGVVDCHDSSDEKFCEWCRPDQFICPEAKHCVDRSALCDGRFDCADGADERHCVALDTSASEAEAGTDRYSPSGLLLVRKRGVWGRLCVDQLDGVVRQSRGGWGADELGRAVCKALTYQDAKEVKPIGPNVSAASTETTDDPFFKLLFSPNTVLPEAEKASLVFAEDSCPRQTALHVTCDQLQCGLRPRVKQRQARIVGGGNSSPGAWPWQAAMYRDGEYQCGATLISDRWLLSAGHCYLRSTTRFWLARLGAYRRGSSLLSPYERLREVSHVIMHPDYQDVGYVHDIALLRLKEAVQMSDFVRPACLPPPKSDIQNGALCSVVGWGQLFESGKIFPDTLQEVQVPLISSQECKKRTVFMPLYKITENMFCAGYERGGRDACLGDSGGPLMCQELSGEWTLTGITSNGYGCARAGRPGVYTKVSNYARWIDDVTTGPLPPAPRHSCRGHRCRLGRCLSPAEVCDGIVHCSDGSDEEHCSATTLPTAATRSQRL